MLFLQAVRIAWETIRVQKLKSFFTVIGVTIGVTFLIAVVSIVSGMGRYMKDDLIGKLIAVNSFNLRKQPDIQMGDVTEAERRDWRRRPRIQDTDVPAVAAGLPKGRALGDGKQRQPERRVALRAPRRIQVHHGVGALVRDQEDGREQRPPHQRRRNTASARRGRDRQDVADHFFPISIRSGRQARIQGIPYTVIGVVEKQGASSASRSTSSSSRRRKSPLNRWVNPHGVVDASRFRRRATSG
jgi:putative ABC transport system permease protein